MGKGTSLANLVVKFNSWNVNVEGDLSAFTPAVTYPSTHVHASCTSTHNNNNNNSFLKNYKLIRDWWYITLLLAFRRQRQADRSLESILVYIVSSCHPRLHSDTLIPASAFGVA